MNYKHCQRIVISSYSDVRNLSPDVSVVHFRKFISEKLLTNVFKKSPRVKIICLSKYAAKRSKQIISKIPKKIVVIISKEKGRPSSIEKNFYM